MKNNQTEAPGATFTRILISEDQQILKDLKSELSTFSKPLLKFKTAYEGLEIGLLTNEVFKEITTTGTGNLLNRYFTIVENELDKAGLTRASSRVPALDQASETFSSFSAVLKELEQVNSSSLNSGRPALKLEEISFIDGEFTISEVDSEAILEKFCRVYLENEFEAGMKVHLEKVRDAINGFNSYLDEFAQSFGLSGSNDLNRYINLKDISSLHKFLIDEEVKEINMESIKWVSEMIDLALYRKNKDESDRQRQAEKATAAPRLTKEEIFDYNEKHRAKAAAEHSRR